MVLLLRSTFAFVLALLTVSPAVAQGVNGVGRLEEADKGAFCSGALVAPDLVLTAAHCVAKFTGDTNLEKAKVAFRPGRLRGSLAIAAADVILHPLYRRALNDLQRLRFDLALVRLAEPVPGDVSGSLDYGIEAELGERLFIVSWRGTDGGTPRQRACEVLRGYPGLVTLGCEVWGGESGSPVLRLGADGLEVVAVLSSKSEALSRPTAQASNVVVRLPALMQELERKRGEDGS